MMWYIFKWWITETNTLLLVGYWIKHSSIDRLLNQTLSYWWIIQTLFHWWNWIKRSSVGGLLNLMFILWELRWSTLYVTLLRSGVFQKHLWNLRTLRFSWIKCSSFNVWVRYFVWNFRRYLWNSTLKILLMHWKIRFLYSVEILRALRFKSS